MGSNSVIRALRLTGLLGLLGLATGCTVEADGPFRCESDRNCSDDRVCVEGTCMPGHLPDGAVGDASAEDAAPDAEDDADDGVDERPDDLGPPLDAGSPPVDAAPPGDAAPIDDAAPPPVDAAPPPIDAAPPPPDAGGEVWPAPPADPDCDLRGMIIDGNACAEPLLQHHCVAGTCAPYACTRPDCNANGPVDPLHPPVFEQFDLVFMQELEPQGEQAVLLRKWWRQAAILGDCGAACLQRAHAECGEQERLPTIYELLRLMPRTPDDLQALQAAGFQLEAIDYDAASGAFTGTGALVSRTVTAAGLPVHMRWEAGEAWPTISDAPLPDAVFSVCVSPLSRTSQFNPDERVTPAGQLPHGPEEALFETWTEDWARLKWIWLNASQGQPAAAVACQTLGFRLPTVQEIWSLFDSHPDGPRFLLDIDVPAPGLVWAADGGADQGGWWVVDVHSGAVQPSLAPSAWTVCTKPL